MAIRSKVGEVLRPFSKAFSFMGERVYRSEGSEASLFECPPSAGRYLQYENVPFSVSSAPGFGHQVCNVVCLIEEARILGRIPVLPVMILPSLHNHGKTQITRFRKYLSFFSICKDLDILFNEEVEDFRFDSCFRCDSRVLTSDLLEREEQLLVREFTTWKFYEAAECFPAPLGEVDGTSRRWLNCFAEERLGPSRRVRALAAEVCSVLGPRFVGLHVRRGDRVFDAKWNEATSPGNILRRLQKWVPPGETVYILSDETDRAFFQPLVGSYRIKTSFDFPVLRELVDREFDNFMLFAVEREIMRQAIFGISTEFMKGPVLTKYSLIGPDHYPMPSIFN